MEIKEKIIEYLKNKYNPQTIFVYGSYADGTNDSTSDFDCLIIVEDKNISHDDSLVEKVRLDCFIYDKDEIGKLDVDTFLPIYWAEIVKDNGIGKDLKEKVKNYVKEKTFTDENEKNFLISWIRKTLNRVEKGDLEGDFRAISFLAESLEDYYLLRDMYYFGSKKAISFLKTNDKKAYELFAKAITNRLNKDIIQWGKYIIFDN